MYRKQTLLLFPLFFLFAVTRATAIIIYITPQFVILAADSRGLFTDTKTGREKTRSVSKIFRSGSLYFGLAGLSSASSGGLEVSRIVDRQLKRTDSFALAVDRVRKEVADSLQGYLTRLRKTNEPSFRRHLKSGRYVSSVGIVGYRNGRPLACLIGFRLRTGDRLQVTAEVESYPEGANRDAVYYLGKTEAIHRYMDTVRSIREEPHLFVDRLMGVQAKATPASVGGPVDMLRIGREGPVWVRRKRNTPVEL